MGHRGKLGAGDILLKYRSGRGVSGPWRIAGDVGEDGYRAALVIPALAESSSLPRTLAALAANPSELLRRTLILVVVNNRTDSSAKQCEDNQKVLALLASRPFPPLQLGWIDAASPRLELPAAEGVGLARKIGFDLALSRLDWNQKHPLLISLDADTLVDPHYLPCIFRFFETSKAVGGVLPFRHQAASPAAREAAIRNYELYLRSYLFGLQQAGSPYAYHSIGSAFACRAASYVAAGGMNRRRAGEDFYFLQSLAKNGDVALLEGTVVRPASRDSRRVPFGTGRVVETELSGGGALYRFIPVESFQLLAGWLGLVRDNRQAGADQLLERAGQLSVELAVMLEELGFSRVWTRLQRNHRQPGQRLAAFHRWFDALRTRQLLTRGVRQESAGGPQLVAELLNWGGYDGFANTADQLSLLEKLQGVHQAP